MYDVNLVLVMNHKFDVTVFGDQTKKFADLHSFNISECEGVVEPFSAVPAAVLCLIRDHYRLLIKA